MEFSSTTHPSRGKNHNLCNFYWCVIVSEECVTKSWYCLIAAKISLFLIHCFFCHSFTHCELVFRLSFVTNWGCSRITRKTTVRVGARELSGILAQCYPGVSICSCRPSNHHQRYVVEKTLLKIEESGRTWEFQKMLYVPVVWIAPNAIY